MVGWLQGRKQGTGACWKGAAPSMGDRKPREGRSQEGEGPFQAMPNVAASSDPAPTPSITVSYKLICGLICQRTAPQSQPPPQGAAAEALELWGDTVM